MGDSLGWCMKVSSSLIISQEDQGVWWRRRVYDVLMRCLRYCLTQWSRIRRWVGWCIDFSHTLLLQRVLHRGYDNVDWVYLREYSREAFRHFWVAPESRQVGKGLWGSSRWQLNDVCYCTYVENNLFCWIFWRNLISRM